MFTRSTFRLVMWTLPLLLLTLACRAATNLALPDTPTSPPLPTFTAVPVSTDALILPVTGITEQAASCPATLDGIITAAATPGGSAEPDEEEHLATYKVIDGEISEPVFDTIPVDLKDEQDDVLTQQKIWTYFTSLVPEQTRSMIAEYSILTDGEDNLLAAVSQSDRDPTQWELQVDIVDSSDYASLTFTMIHETGHLLTLNADQVPPSLDVFNDPGDKEAYDQAVSQCSNYFPGEGCSNPTSYINHFYQRFWSDIYAEWSQIDQIEDEREYYERMNEFYQNYEDRFVTQYAATNPAEDIAESWAYFVLAPKPQGNTISDQKVLFFYEHPELVELRAQILDRLCVIFPQ